jgi:hypothetical protein
MNSTSQPDYQNVSSITYRLSTLLAEAKRIVEESCNVKHGSPQGTAGHIKAGQHIRTQDTQHSKAMIHPCTSKTNRGFGSSTTVLLFRDTNARSSGTKRAASTEEATKAAGTRNSVKPQSKRRKTDTLAPTWNPVTAEKSHIRTAPPALTQVLNALHKYSTTPSEQLSTTPLISHPLLSATPS